MALKIIQILSRKLMHLRLQPVRVYCFHHVSEEIDSLVCKEEDWTQIGQFRRNIEELSKQYTFISLSEAYSKLRHDVLRFKKYAVLTTDDGLASVKNVLPWLEERDIPLTLFVNTGYFEGNKLKPIHKKWLREIVPGANTKAIAQKMYLSKEQIWELTSSLIEICMHGHEHLDCTQISEGEFESDLQKCEVILKSHPRYMAAYAFPWGKATEASMNYLKEKDIIPVLINGNRNYKWETYIDRECIDNKVNNEGKFV